MTYSKNDSNNLELQERLKIFQRQENRLIATIAYELWNPLSTIQVCLESLAHQSPLDLESKQVLLEAGIKDVRYLRQLIQDCIDRSQWELTEKCDRYKVTEKSLQIAIDRLLKLSQTSNSAYLATRAEEKNFILNDCSLEAFEHICENFIAIVGHELKTPLCAIQVCLESLNCEDVLSLKQTEYQQTILEIAIEDLERLKELIRDFFILARLQQGHLCYCQEYIEVSTILELAIASINNRKGCRSLPNIDIDLPCPLPKIKTDGDRLTQAIIKLLDNACKFTQPQGKIRIEVRLIDTKKQSISSLALEEDNLFLEVVISDTGRGINPHNLNAIFNCFYQEENALKRTVNGVGIGLTICDRIIQNLGGKIWANSAGKERGSSIHFTVPVAI